MNNTHKQIIKYLREKVSEDENPLGNFFIDSDDEQAIRLIFSNYRNNSGLRLTSIGLMLMKSYFKYLEIKMPEGYKIKTPHILYLDRNTTLPYHFTAEYLVVFETNFGIKLKLADGEIQTLIDMEK